MYKGSFVSTSAPPFTLKVKNGKLYIDKGVGFRQMDVGCTD